MEVNSPDLDFDVLHEIGSRMAAADPFHEVLARVVDFAVGVVKCDSCFVYVLQDDELVLRASKNPHEDIVDRLKLRMGQGITGWVAEHRETVAVSQNAFHRASKSLTNCRKTVTKLSCQFLFYAGDDWSASLICRTASAILTSGVKFN